MLKRTIFLILAALFALPAFADSGSKTTPCYTVGKTINVDSGCTLNVKSGGTVNLQSGSTETRSGSTDVSGIVYSTGLTGNPLVQNNRTDVLVSTSLTSASMTTIIASAAGRTIYPFNPTIMVSGTAATATALALECSDGTLIASWPIANLVTLKPMGIGLYTSASAADATITTGAGLLGCPASTAVMLSNVGTNLTTTTHVYTDVPYTVQ